MGVSDLSSWESLKLNPTLLKGVQDAGFGPPTEIQEKVIPLVLGGQQVIGIAQTGTGKTAAYLLPILKKVHYAQGTMPRALVLAPTKELVVQIASHARQLAAHSDIRIIELYGGIGPKSQIEQLKAGSDLIVATPGRFLELYLKNEIPVKQIRTLVLDEADRMMDMGFMPQLRRVFEVIPPKRQNLLFSATFSPRVEKMSQEFIDFPVKVEITPQFTAASTVEQNLYKVPNFKTKINLLHHLLADETFHRVIIFVRTKSAADDIAKFIERMDRGPVRVIHSNKGQNARINAMNEFRQGGLRVLVSTDVSARGIDVAEVSHVINFDVPLVYDDYIHRIGRTGRAFRTGKAISFVTEAEMYHIRKIEELMKEKISSLPLPAEVSVEETSWEESQEMAREIDRQKRLEDPEYQGAFHERKKK